LDYKTPWEILSEGGKSGPTETGKKD
jgi:hypothetical protein